MWIKILSIESLVAVAGLLFAYFQNNDFERAIALVPVFLVITAMVMFDIVAALLQLISYVATR